MNKKNKGFTTIELITSFTLASVIMIILFNIILILKDNLSKVNAKTNMLVEKDNLSYNINKRFKDKEISSITMCNEGDKCYEFTYSDSTSDKLIYSNTDKTITFNNYTFDIIDGITVEEPTITEHYDTMSSTKYNGYFIINIPIKLDNKDYSIKINKHFNTDSLVIDTRKIYDQENNRYTIVDYLESTGTQYIDTGVNGKSTLNIASKFYINQLSHNVFALFGSRNEDYSESIAMWILQNKIRADYGTSLKYYFFNSSSTGIVELGYNKNMVYLNSEESNFTYEDYSNDLSIAIFSCNNSGIFDVRRASVKLYYFKIYDNSTLVRDYIPVIDSSERPCLFDKVSRECYYNQGTGEFLYG